MSAYFVTATGTEIGKTYVTAGLVRHLRARNEPVFSLKPVVSGFSMSEAEASDPGILLRALGEVVNSETIARISPWRFAAPLSPDIAAARESRTIAFDELVGFCSDMIGVAKGIWFIEGVGGVMVPLDAQHTVVDWIAALGTPVILVVGSYLGTISHTLTALDALKRRDVPVAAIVVNESAGAPVSSEETARTIARFAPKCPIQTLSRDAPGAAQEFMALWSEILVRDELS
jgi:dethiobiotin synthetase